MRRISSVRWVTPAILFIGMTVGQAGCSSDADESGTDGTTATDGTTSADGTTSTDGTSGADGSTAADGSTSTDGTTGTTSSDGTDGTSAVDGTDGTTAADGTDGTDGMCTPNEAFCSGTFLFTCNAAGTDQTQVECPHGCENDACLEKCTPGSECVGEQLETCDADGMITKTFCEAGCEDGACNEIPEVCTPGEELCEPGGKKILKCAEDGLSASAVETCPFGCDSETVTCAPAACEAGDTRCAEDETNVVEICLADQSGWKKAESACKHSCKDGECFVPNCTPNEEQCGVTGVEQCDEGGNAFTVVELCKSGCVNTVDGPVCAKCVEGLKQCQGSSVESCNDSTVGFVTTQECSDIQACVSGQCVDVVVLSGDKSVEENYLKLMLAFVDCFTKAVPGSCSALDASGIDYDITAGDIGDWFCDNVGDPSFDSKFDAAELVTAEDIAGCGTFNVEDMSFETGQVTGGLTGQECLGFDDGGLLSANDKEIVVDLCINFEDAE